MKHVEWFPLVNVTRHPLTENHHFGIVVIADENGQIVHSLGNSNHIVFPRSALKPIQTLPVIESGATNYFGFGPAELAIMCGSHSGESQHIKLVKSMLERIDLDESALMCGKHIPLYYQEHYDKKRPSLSTFSTLHHNCSGKHSGFLAHACYAGVNSKRYLDKKYPTQKAVKQAVLRITNTSPKLLVESIDGCSAPTFAIPLVNLATAYARLSTATKNTDLGTLREAMIAFPNLVSGTERTDEILMHLGKGKILAKFGSDGIQAIGLPDRGIGIAIKIADGNPKAAIAVTIAILKKIHVLTSEEAKQASAATQLTVRTARGIPIGEYRANIKLL